MTGSTYYPSQSSPTTTLSTQLPLLLCFLQIRVSTHDSKYLSTQFLLKVLTRWHRILRNCTSTSMNSFNAQSSSMNVTLKTITSPFQISKSVTWFGLTRETFRQDNPQRSLTPNTLGHSQSSRRFRHTPFDLVYHSHSGTYIQSSMYHCCSPPTLVPSPTASRTLLCRWNWMMMRNTRSRESLTVKSTSAKRGLVSSTLLNGRALTTLLNP